jgi:hypothetical protein
MSIVIRKVVLIFEYSTGNATIINSVIVLTQLSVNRPDRKRK